MHYSCDALVVTCVDARFQKPLDRWLHEKFGYGGYDRVSFVGGVKSWGVISSQIVMCKALHDVKKVVLVNHEDCAVYGRRADVEIHHHLDLHLAQRWVMAEFPELLVELYYAKLDGNFVQIG